MSRDAAVAAVCGGSSQAIEFIVAAVRRGGSGGGLRRFQKTQKNQMAAVLRRLRWCSPHTPMRFRGALRARRGRTEAVRNGAAQKGFSLA